MRSLILSCLIASALAHDRNKRSVEEDEMAMEKVNYEAEEANTIQTQPNFLARIIGEEAQARVVESVTNWASDRARENPGCVERFVCETYKTGETLSGLPYLLMTLTNAAVSFMIAEQFGEAVQMEAITRAAKYGRITGTCHRMECPFLEGQELRSVADYLTGLEEIIGYIIDSVSTSLG